jgi:hypothetical protein
VKQIDESASDEDVLSGGAPVGILDDRQTTAAAVGVSREAGINRRLSFERSVAYHESGHATVSRLLGLPVAGATIEFHNGFFGCTWAADGAELQADETVADICRQLTPLMPDGGSRADIAGDLQWAADQIISLLAGPIAEEMFCSVRLPGSEHDLADAACLAQLICRSPAAAAAFLSYAKAEAVALLTDNRAVVLAIADGLIRHRTLNGEQIDANCKRSTQKLKEVANGQRNRNLHHHG